MAGRIGHGNRRRVDEITLGQSSSPKSLVAEIVNIQKLICLFDTLEELTLTLPSWEVRPLADFTWTRNKGMILEFTAPINDPSDSGKGEIINLTLDLEDELGKEGE